MGIPKFFMTKTVQNWVFPFFVPKIIKNFGNPHVLPCNQKFWKFPCLRYPCDQKSANFLEFPMENVGKVFGIPLTSLGGVHLNVSTQSSCNKTLYEKGNTIVA